MYNFIDGDFFESLADYSFGDMYSSNVTQPSYSILKSVFDKFEKPKIFIETHRLGHLFRELGNFSDRKCIIIAHNSDATFGQELLQYVPNNVEKLWCQNYNYIETDVVKSLPIGLERVRWFPEQKKQELLFNTIQEDVERTNLVYMNFNPGTNPIRTQIYDTLKDKDFINQEMIGNGGDYKNYLINLKKHKFIISPPGNGIDCHRNWETIYCGCIPIVLDSHFSRNIFKNENVMIVKDYNTINEHDLINNYLDKLSKFNTYDTKWKSLIEN